MLFDNKPLLTADTPRDLVDVTNEFCDDQSIDRLSQSRLNSGRPIRADAGYFYVGPVTAISIRIWVDKDNDEDEDLGS